MKILNHIKNYIFKKEVKLFLDDIRKPSDVGLKNNEYIILRNSRDISVFFKRFIPTNKLIKYITFDHDLGETYTGMDFAKQIVEFDIMYGILSKDFKFNVHSANPVGAENIKSYMMNYLKHKEG